MKKHSHNNQHTIDQIIENFVHFGHSKSGGHGGQKVNKKQTKAELFFDMKQCKLISDEQKKILREVYHKWVNKEDVLHMSSAEERNFHSNQKRVTQHFHELMESVFAGNTHHLRGWHGKHH